MRAHVVYTTYTNMVHVAGGIALILIPLEAKDIDRVLNGIDGLLLKGGGDVGPTQYGGRATKRCTASRPRRGRVRVGRRAACSRQAMPTLAICRGMQVLNVALDGPLIEDLATEPGLGTEHRRHGTMSSTRSTVSA